jgi:hypothetical protein
MLTLNLIRAEEGLFLTWPFCCHKKMTTLHLRQAVWCSYCTKEYIRLLSLIVHSIPGACELSQEWKRYVE